MKIGDKIQDIEDNDCYYEGIVISVNPIKYKITKIVWDNKVDYSRNGDIIKTKWWYIKKI